MKEENKTNNIQASPKAEDKEMALDDARRVKVLSPGMLVAKRFFRNKLAIIGLVILVVLFLFAFIGGLITPYSQTQVFKGMDMIQKDYAAAVYNSELRYTMKEGETLSGTAKSQIALATSKGNNTFEADGAGYTLIPIGEDSYQITKLDAICTVLTSSKAMQVKEGETVSDGLKSAINAALDAGQNLFSHDGVDYEVRMTGKKAEICKSVTLGIASKLVIDAYSADSEALVNSYDFRLECEKAYHDNKTSFAVDGEKYTLETDEDGDAVVYDAAGEAFAAASHIIVNPNGQGITLSIEFKTAARDAVETRTASFTVPDASGSEVEYKMNVVNSNFYFTTIGSSELIRRFEAPSVNHWLGLDSNGMDVLTRLMYGGRISLLVGFVVVFVELFIGIIVGGVAGYFGKVVDNILMRVVDLFNSIPFYPMAMIVGAVMDSLDISSTARIFALMFVLAVLGWTNVARTVRGQILSLREQEFMMATEATGIPVKRRIFRHLIPNVMPLLIVQATMNLGSIIITEATLSFLGLGLKYPLASWGSIINAANDIQVMTSYWYIWMPPGLLILLAVLGFNFVGDGLRDAFDPKMKR